MQLQSNQQHTGRRPVRRSQRDSPKGLKTMPVDAVLIVCGLVDAAGDVIANALAAFEHEGMCNIADFDRMTDKDIIEMCMAMNARATSQNGC